MPTPVKIQVFSSNFRITLAWEKDADVDVKSFNLYKSSTRAGVFSSFMVGILNEVSLGNGKYVGVSFLRSDYTIGANDTVFFEATTCLLYTSPSPRD